MNDLELYNTVNKMTDTKSLFSMTGYATKKSPYKNRRDQLIKELTSGINKLRLVNGYKPITAKWLAIKANMNPFLKSDDELELVKQECEFKGNYKKLFWILK